MNILCYFTRVLCGKLIVRELKQVLVSYLRGGKIAKERLTVRIGGWLGMGGNKMDAIDFYT